MADIEKYISPLPPSWIKAKEHLGDAGVKSCIYCGSYGLTKEHLFGKWSREYGLAGSVKHRMDPKGRSEHKLRKFDDPFSPALQTEYSGRYDRRPGNMRSRTMRIVCSQCNNTWMSQIVNSAKSSIRQLSHGYWGSHADENRSSIASWLAMVTMNYEFADLDTVSVPSWERSRFRGSRAPSDRWMIGIGFTVTNLGNDPIRHRSLMVNPQAFDGYYHLIQITTLAFGMMVGLVVYCDIPIQYPFSDFCVRHALAPVWPETGNKVLRPYRAHYDITDDEMMDTLSREILESTEVMAFRR